jgi:hypothetical protein
MKKRKPPRPPDKFKPDATTARLAEDTILLFAMTVLHDKFGFGNERIQRLLKASEPWMQALINGKEGIDVEGIKQTLIDEGIVCLKSTDL